MLKTTNWIILILATVSLAACSSKPLLPYTTETPPLVLTPASYAGVEDGRARFREIFCAVLELRAEELPDYRPCEEALTRLGAEQAGAGTPVDTGPSRTGLMVGIVPGVGWECTAGDGGAIDSLRPGTRQAWLAQNPLPQSLKYYSLVTLPEPDRISSVLSIPSRQLAQIDSRNDGQILFYDQVIPNGTLLAYINADHWALAVPIARSHIFIGSTLIDENDYPREALLEAILRYVEEDLLLQGD